MKKIFIKKTIRKPIKLKPLRRDLQNLLNLLRLDNVEVSLCLAGNRRMRYLNRFYRGIDKTTDVLSFPQSSRAEGRKCKSPEDLRAYRFPKGLQPYILGDIVLNLDRIKKQAIENNVSFKDELRLMLVHGLLHLLGYDHERSERAARMMRKKEKSLINALKKLDRERK